MANISTTDLQFNFLTVEEEPLLNRDQILACVLLNSAILVVLYLHFHLTLRNSHLGLDLNNKTLSYLKLSSYFNDIEVLKSAKNWKSGQKTIKLVLFSISGKCHSMDFKHP